MFLFDKLFIISILLLFTSCAVSTKSKEIESKLEETTNNWECAERRVKVAENRRTWQALAKYTAVPASILKRYNKMRLLKIGEEIHIPARKIYQVKNAETSIGIAIKYGMTFSELVSLNDLETPFTLKNGQKLKIIEVAASIFTHKASNNKKPKLIWPVKGRLVSQFGAEKNGALNDGVRILVNNNSNILAAAAGTIVYVGNEIGNYGNLVIIQHKGEFLSSYGGLSSIKVTKGDIVKTGQIIGEINNAKLYFGLRNGATPVNPLKYIVKAKNR